ncbi:MAG: glycosyltransferase family 2 protein, partial [Gemmatimonadaceae bacterium]
MHEPSYGVVLLNWNGYDDTEAALESLLAATPRPDHVVVVDNGSHDGSVAKLGRWVGENQPLTDDGSDMPWVTVVAERENRGFAMGNNIGLAQLSDRTDVSHFLLLNNDATVAPDYFEEMNEAIRAYPDSALLGCAIFYHPDRDKVWFGGGYELPYRALVLHRYELPVDTTPQRTPFVTGCAMLISRELYAAVGGLAECYTPIYWEDTEYSFRARKGGWRVMLVPTAHVYHKVSASMGGEKTTPRAAFFQNRHRAYYVRRNYRGLDRALALTYLVVTKPGRSVAEVLRGHPAMGSAIFR